MTKKSAFVVAAFAGIAVLVGATQASAQVEKGMNEFGVSTTLDNRTTSANGVSTTQESFTQYLSYDRFLTDHLSLGADILYNGTLSEVPNGKGGTTNTTNNVFGFNGQVKWHFPLPKKTIVPYVGAELGDISITSTGAADINSVDFGFLGGIKFFLTEKTSLNLELNDSIYETTIPAAGPVAAQTVTTNDLQFLAGYSVYF